MRSKRGFRWEHSFFLIFFLGLILISPSGRVIGSAPEGKMTTCTWDPPTYGTPVVHYVLQVVELGSADMDTTTIRDIFTTSHDVYVKFGFSYMARVAGVDAENRQGPWSLWTPVYGPRKKHE